MEHAVVWSSLILGAFGLIVTIIYTRKSQELANDKMMKELYTEFNSRYNKLNDKLSIIESEFPTMEKLEKAVNSEEMKQTIIDFFNLCAEEYYWYDHKKRIDKIVWLSWHNGLKYWYNNIEVIREMWQIEMQKVGSKGYYIKGDKGFFNS